MECHNIWVLSPHDHVTRFLLRGAMIGSPGCWWNESPRWKYGMCPSRGYRVSYSLQFRPHLSRVVGRSALCGRRGSVLLIRHVDLVAPRRGPFLGRGFSRCCVVYALDAWVRVGRISLGPLVSHVGGSLLSKPGNSVAWISGAWCCLWWSLGSLFSCWRCLLLVLSIRNPP